MGQKNTAQKLFEQFKSKPSNRARDQIWALYHDPNFTDADVDINIEDTDDSEISNFVRGSKESLDYKQSKAFLSDLYEFLKEIDQKRERSFRVWENKDKILKEWLIAYGNCQTQPEIIQNNNELNDDQKELITEEGLFIFIFSTTN